MRACAQWEPAGEILSDPDACGRGVEGASGIPPPGSSQGLKDLRDASQLAWVCCWGVPPTPPFHPITPKVTQCHPSRGSRHARCSRGGLEESAERSHDFPDDQRALLCFQRPVSAVRLSSLLFLAASSYQLIATLPFLRLMSTCEKVHRAAHACQVA